MTATSRAAGLFTLSLGLLAGCGDNNEPGPFEDIAGSYISTTFTVTRTGESPEDVLAAGGLMSLGLDADGSTSGTLEIPASITREEPINASMEGTATRSGNTVQFGQEADTFVRDATWIAGEGTLTGSFTNSQGTIGVTLTIMQPD
jgi:hypothetical protein